MAGEQVLAEYLDAREKTNWDAACAHMSSAVIKQLETLAGKGSTPTAEDCMGAYAIIMGSATSLERANPLVAGLAAFRVEGDNAFALFYGPQKQQFMMPMVKDGAVWKVNQIDPIAYPPGAPETSGE